MARERASTSTGEIEDRYPLSPLQQAMLFHDLAAPGSGSYVQHAICDLHEPVDLPLLERAWQRVMERHTVLRTAFRIHGLRDPVQVVHRRPRVEWLHADWNGLTRDEQELRFEAHLESDRRRDFDSTAHPLLRLATFRLGHERHRLLWTYHHALLDGRAVRVVLREVFDLYDAFSAGRDLQLPPPTPYRRYIEWLAKQDTTAASRYWQEALAGFKPMSLIGRRPERVGGVGLAGHASHEIRLTRESSEALRSVASGHGITLNTLVTGAWAQLLGRYSGESTVCFGTTLTLRGAEPSTFGEMVGLLINTVPLRVELPPDMPLPQWLNALRAQWLALRAHAWAPLTRIRQWGGIAPENALFTSLLVYEHTLLDAALAQERSWSTRRFSRRSGASHPATLAVFGEPELSLKLVCDRSLFDAATMAPMLEQLRTALEGVLTDFERPLKDQPLLSAAEKRRILVQWNDTARAFPAEACTHLLFERQAERSPDAPAVEAAGGSLTYRELNERSNRLAHLLRRSDVVPGALVGICMDRCAELIVAMLGVMKAGGAYLPLDAGNPPQRLQHVLESAGVAMLITMEGSVARCGAFRGRLALLDRNPEALAAESAADPAVGVSLEDPAYAVYTSGSTGEPKGILVAHRALANHTLALVERYGLSPADRRLQFVSIGSDVLIAEVFPVLVAGGTIVLRPEGPMPPIGDFLRLLEERRVTIAGLPSAYWHEWVATMSGDGLPFPSALRLVVSGMDRVRPDLFAVWRKKANKRVRWFNAYGPSETTCTAASYEADLSSDEAMSSIPIGRPLPNVRIYILDALARPIPVGVTGEICIGGRGVARGYINRPELTAEKFVPDPFSDRPGDRLYKTGDLGRYLPDGNIEFLGRLDDQVKIRGFRVEPGEVEVALRRLPQVREACVLARGDDPDARRLIAYAVPTAGARPTSSDLRAQLRRSLPDYMVPTAIVVIPAIPFMLSGKADYAALPDPDLSAEEARRSLARPSKPLEQALTAIWEELLQTRVGARDNFFDLGGDSLRGVQLLDKVLVDFGVEIPIEALFDDAATVATMASRIEQERTRPVRRAGAPPVARRPLGG